MESRGPASDHDQLRHRRRRQHGTTRNDRWSCTDQLWVVFLSILVAACSGSLSQIEVDRSDPPPLAGDLETEVQGLARPLVEEGVTPGIVVGVLLPDRSTHFFGYGVTEQGGNTSPGADTLFAIGSISKGFLAAITASLVQEGVLSWEDSLGRLLPPGTPLSADAARITLLQLATHTSGLPRQPHTVQLGLYFAEYLFTGRSFYRHFDTEYVLRYLAEFKSSSRTEVAYSSFGYAILGHAIQQRTDRSLDELLASRILAPLDLPNTGYVPEALPGYPTRARGYAGDQPKFVPRGTPVPDWEFTPVMKGAGALYSSARDLLTFAAAHFGASDTTLRRALVDTLRMRTMPGGTRVAVAWEVDDLAGGPIAYQLGLVGGFTSYVGLDADRGTAVVVLQNTFNWRFSVGPKLLTRIRRMGHSSST